MNGTAVLAGMQFAAHKIALTWAKENLPGSKLSRNQEIVPCNIEMDDDICGSMLYSCYDRVFLFGNGSALFKKRRGGSDAPREQQRVCWHV